MRLKLITSIFLGIGFATLIAFPFILTSSPGQGASYSARRAYALRLALLSGSGIVSLVGSGIGAILLQRRAREEYREEARRNLEGLVEGLKRDQGEREPNARSEPDA